MRTEEEVVANSVLQQEWRRLQGYEGTERAAAQPSKSSKPIEGDCPICYDTLEPGGATAQVLCLLSLEPSPPCGRPLREKLLSAAAVAFPLISIALATSSLTVGGHWWAQCRLLIWLLLFCL